MSCAITTATNINCGTSCRQTLRNYLVSLAGIRFTRYEFAHQIRYRILHVFLWFYELGISLSVVSGDSIVWQWNGGFTRLNGTQKVNSQTRFRLASITKAFTSTLLFQLVSRGVVQSADDRIKHYIPDFNIVDPFRPNSGSRTASQLTFKQLSSHLAGLPREPPCSWEDCNYSTRDVRNLHDCISEITFADKFVWFFADAEACLNRSSARKAELKSILF
jgi:hypothetical protein